MDFTATYSHGEYTSKYYSGHRMWDAYRNWGINLPDTYDNLRYEKVYPTTIPAARLLTVQDFFATYRSHYEGTKYDLTKGLAAGPFGDPDRFMPKKDEKVVGNWERAIGIFRTGYTEVVQLKRSGQGSLLWFAPHAAASSCFVPISNQMTEVPSMYMNANPNPEGLSRDSAYWAHRYVFSSAKIMYSHAMKNVTAMQQKLENEAVKLVAHIDAQMDAGDSVNATVLYQEHAEKVLRSFWTLPDTIVATYSDGWLADKANVGYPDWWLKAVGYEEGPKTIPDVPPANAMLESQQCDDAALRECIIRCPKSVGFADCAIECTQHCRKKAEPESSPLIV
jgi:dipeptidase